MGAGSETAYRIAPPPPPIDAQLSSVPAVHASAAVANHVNVRRIRLKASSICSKPGRLRHAAWEFFHSWHRAGDRLPVDTDSLATFDRRPRNRSDARYSSTFSVLSPSSTK